MTSPRPAGTAVLAEGLRKSFGAGGGRVEAVAGLDLRVDAGQIFGFLGPNGAGKTTTLRMLTTLVPPDAGRAVVAGVDVARDAAGVRRRIGYVGQLGGTDRMATGRENLELQGQLYGASAAAAKARAIELIDLLALSDFADRRAATYSGGQRRRLEVALGIMHRPAVLFLDEPTTGLDPQNRANLWDQLRALRAAGTTIFLTTHYLEEADALADRLAIVDHGRVVAEGTPPELKRELGATVVIRADLPPEKLSTLRGELAALPAVERADCAETEIRLAVRDATRVLPAVAALVHERRVPLQALSIAEPSLDDVFLRQTGRSLRDAGETALDGPATVPAGGAR